MFQEQRAYFLSGVLILNIFSSSLMLGLNKRRHETKHNDIQHNNIQYNDI